MSDQDSNLAIICYTYGMDTGDWELAVSHVAEHVDVDYSAVGMAKSSMTRAELGDFLRQLLDKPGLRVHTALSQIFPNPNNPGEMLAYYSVRHYKGQPGRAEKFIVFGWYSYILKDGRITSLRINVSALEGNPAVLA